MNTNNSNSPDTAPVGKHFEQAREGEVSPPIPAGEQREIVSKMQIEELEKQRAKTTPQLVLKPEGAQPSRDADKELLKRIERMQERLSKPRGKARDDFEREAGRSR